MARKGLLGLCSLFVIALSLSGSPWVVLQATPGDGQRSAANTWSATSSTGRIFNGTWTAVVNPKTGAVTGTWTLADASGKTVLGGDWSAAKAAAGWTGTWRATVSGRTTAYRGTWSANLDIQPNARFADLFEQAARTAVGGGWRTGGYSGSWSIRASK